MNKLAIYKGKGRGAGKYGAIQFEPTVARATCEVCKKTYYQDAGQEIPRTCCDRILRFSERKIIINAAASTKADTYDWDNKIVFALGLVDIGKIKELLIDGGISTSAGKKNELELFHDPGAATSKRGKVTKTMKVSIPKPRSGAIVTMTEREQGKDPKRVTVPLSRSEVLNLLHLLVWFTPHALNWA